MIPDCAHNGGISLQTAKLIHRFHGPQKIQAETVVWSLTGRNLTHVLHLVSHTITALFYAVFAQRAHFFNQMPPKRTDAIQYHDQNPILRDQDGEPRHDAPNLDDFTIATVKAELDRVRNDQAFTTGARTSGMIKRNIVTELQVDRYGHAPLIAALKERCKDLGLSVADNLSGWMLRKALDRRHTNEHSEKHSVWDDVQLLNFCNVRGLDWQRNSRVVDRSSLLFKVLKYELEVAQDRPQKLDRCTLDWRLIHYQDPAFFSPPLSPELEGSIVPPCLFYY